jgi:Zn-finger nucleic acid-binding protein
MDPAPPASCPRCRKVPLDDQPLVRHCSRCKGSWISEETLHERAAAARSAWPGQNWRKEGRAALMCAICAAPMETLVVRDTPVDRCVLHGVWFDANELAHVLSPVAAATSQVTVNETHGSVAADLVEDSIELAIDAADMGVTAGEIVETGGGVFEVVIDGVGFVAEVVVDAIAGIFSALD